MYSYYLQRGHKLDDLMNLTYMEKIFYSESMLYEIERETKKLNSMF